MHWPYLYFLTHSWKILINWYPCLFYILQPWVKGFIGYHYVTEMWVCISLEYTYFKIYRTACLCQACKHFWNHSLLKMEGLYNKWCHLNPTQGTRVSVVGWSTMLQAGRSRVRFSTWSMDFSIDLILPAALWPLGSTQPPRILPGGEGRPAHKTNNLTVICEPIV
jgi:hypothetical protein